MKTTTTNPTTMTTTTTNTTNQNSRRLWTGRVMSGIVVLFLLFDSIIKLLRVPAAVEGTVQLGYPPSVLLGLGIVLLACVVTYLVPRTALVGAVLLTGYLGGAIATHVRVGHPLLSHTLFPIYVAALIWGGLFLRDERVRALIRPRATT
ncbi:MAG: hypothetical protein QOI66_1193 [Myxococcales bacterium]|nr:hypothetical protein [Myxococcales bacterium]